MKITALPLLGATALLSLTALAGCLSGAQAAPPADARASHVFAQSMPDTKGRSQSLAQWRGKTLVVNFWATWCAPCVKEMPELAALQTELAGKDVQIIGVGIDSSDNIAAFSTKYAIGYPLYAAGEGGTRLLGALGDKAGSLPFTLLIGPDGAVRKSYLGRLNIAALRQDVLAARPAR